ncbi:hypothetical protein A4S05_30455 [Nostoc sp. KVJ20]|nr:hypothetical protein A4S05_30455 [Nostoc sp. KVJ20]
MTQYCIEQQDLQLIEKVRNLTLVKITPKIVPKKLISLARFIYKLFIRRIQNSGAEPETLRLRSEWAKP